MQPNNENLPDNNFDVPPPPPIEPPVISPQPAPEPMQYVQPQPVYNTQKDVVPTVNPASKKKTLLIVGIVIGSVLLLALFVTIGLVIYNNANQKKSDDQSVVVKDEPKVESAVVVPAGYKRIGESKFGFLNVPEDWVEFKEIGADSGIMMQYSDKAGFSVVTVTKYTQGLSLDELTSMLLESMASGPSVVQTVVKVNGLSTKRLSQDYSSSQGKILDTYVFEETDQLSTISIEYAPADVEIAKSIITSYRLLN